MKRIYKPILSGVILSTPLLSLVACSSNSEREVLSPEKTNFAKIESVELSIEKGRQIAEKRHQERIDGAISEAKSLAKDTKTIQDQENAQPIPLTNLNLISRDDFLKLDKRSDFFLFDLGKFKYINLLIKEDSLKAFQDGLICEVAITSSLFPSSKTYAYEVFIDGFASQNASKPDQFKSEFEKRINEIDDRLKDSNYDQNININELLSPDLLDRKNHQPILTARQITPDDFVRISIDSKNGIYGYVTSSSALSQKEIVDFYTNNANDLTASQKIELEKEGTTLKASFIIKSSSIRVLKNVQIDKYLTNLVPQATYEGINKVRILSSLSKVKISELPRDGVIWAGGINYFSLSQAVSYLEAMARELGWKPRADDLIPSPDFSVKKDYKYTIEQENKALDGVHFDESKWDPKTGKPRNVAFDAVGSAITMGTKWPAYQDPDLRRANGVNLDISSFGNAIGGNNSATWDNIFIRHFQEWIEPNGVVALKVWTDNGLSRTFRTPEGYERSFPKIETYIDQDSTFKDKLVTLIVDSLKFIKKTITPSDTLLEIAKGIGVISPYFEDAFRFLGSLTVNDDLTQKIEQAISDLDGTHYYPAITTLMRGVEGLPDAMKRDTLPNQLNGFLTMNDLFEIRNWGNLAPNRVMSFNEYDARIAKSLALDSDDYLIDEVEPFA